MDNLLLIRAARLVVPCPGGCKGRGTTLLWKNLFSLRGKMVRYLKHFEAYKTRMVAIEGRERAPVAPPDSARLLPISLAGFAQLFTEVGRGHGGRLPLRTPLRRAAVLDC